MWLSVDVAPILAAHGCRVIVPHLRGHGTTRFLNSSTPRTGQQAAVGQDIIALMDALKIGRAVLAGYDWGARTACVVAALWPERCVDIVSVNGYLVQDIAKAGLPIPAKIEFGLWYQYYFATERGRAGLTANRRDIARVIWAYNSPTWRFDDATFDRSAAAFDNPDCVDIVINNYRFRLGLLRYRLILNMKRWNDVWQRFLSLRCRQSPWMAGPTAWYRPMMAKPMQQNSVGHGCIASYRMPDTICRKRPRKHSPMLYRRL